MGRNFEAQNIISVPRTNAPGGFALGTAIVTAAKGKKNLPKNVAAALNKVETATAALGKALSGRLSVEGGPEARAADIAADNAWSALSEFVSAWSRLPESNPQGKKAREVQAAIFGEGLKFVQLAFKQEWAEGDARLQQMRAHGHEAALRSLGGGALLDHLLAAHQKYGEVLGITGQKAAAQIAVDMREMLESFAKTLRSYALQVAAMAEEDAKAQELANELLEPLTSWETKLAAQAAAPQPAPTPAG